MWRLHTGTGGKADGKAADHRCPMRSHIAEDQSNRAAGKIADEAHIVVHMAEHLSYLVIALRIVVFRGQSLPAAGHLQVAYAWVSGDVINHGMLRQPRPLRSQIPQYIKNAHRRRDRRILRNCLTLSGNRTPFNDIAPWVLRNTRPRSKLSTPARNGWVAGTLRGAGRGWLAKGSTRSG